MKHASHTDLFGATSCSQEARIHQVGYRAQSTLRSSRSRAALKSKPFCQEHVLSLNIHSSVNLMDHAVLFLKEGDAQVHFVAS
jgi:hypothetical protein